MDDNIRELLEEQIASDFGDLATLEMGSEEHARAVEDLTKLYKLRIEENAAASDRSDKEDEKTERVIDRYLKYGVEIAGILLPLAFYAYWMKKGFKFEETGTFTSTTFRGLFSKFRPAGH